MYYMLPRHALSSAVAAVAAAASAAAAAGDGDGGVHVNYSAGALTDHTRRRHRCRHW